MIIVRYLKAVSICLIFACQLFVQKCDILLGGGGSKICDSLWQGGGGVKNHQKKRDILYGRPPSVDIGNGSMRAVVSSAQVAETAVFFRANWRLLSLLMLGVTGHTQLASNK